MFKSLSFIYLLIAKSHQTTMKDCTVEEIKVKSASGVCDILKAKGSENCSVVTLQETLNEIYAEPKIPILPHFYGPNFKYSHDFQKVSFSCKALFNTALSYKGIDNEKCEMTPELQSSYDCDGHVTGSVKCLHNPPEKQNGASTIWKWDEDAVSTACKRFNSCNAYGNTACAEAMEIYADKYISGKIGMVLGTQIPWAEGGLIKWGANKVTTVEYNPIESSFHKLSSIHPFELAERYANQTTEQNEAEQVDFIFTYSSLEHDGLGRYGDPMNPFADLESIARAHCLLKHSGVLFLGVPIGPDYVSNSHRIYGKLRLGLILPMWEPIDLVNNRFHLNDGRIVGQYDNQAIWVLRKKGHMGEKSAGGIYLRH